MPTSNEILGQILHKHQQITQFHFRIRNAPMTAGWTSYPVLCIVGHNLLGIVGHYSARAIALTRPAAANRLCYRKDVLRSRSLAPTSTATMEPGPPPHRKTCARKRTQILDERPFGPTQCTGDGNRLSALLASRPAEFVLNGKPPLAAELPLASMSQAVQTGRRQ